MRWGNTGNGSFGVGATAYTLASRDENASYYYYQEPSASLTASQSASTFGVPPSYGQPRGVVQAKKPPDKRRGKRIVGSNTRPSKGNRELKAPRFAVGESPEAASGKPESTGHAPLIMCAGKSVYGTTSDSSSEECDNNDINQRSDDNATQHNDRSTPFRAIAAAKTTRVGEPYSSPRQRTDEELEQIIRDLRDQVFQNKQKQDHGQQHTLRSAASAENAAEGGSQTQTHHRKHLKNPVERMEGVAASSGSNPVTNNGLLLQRPLSSCQLNRFVTESTIQMVVPAVIYDAHPATVRAGTRTSSNNADGQVSLLDFSSLRSRSRPKTSSGCRPGVKQSLHLGEVAALNPRHLQSKQASAATRIRRQKGSDKARDQEHYDGSSDCGEGYLYLVDVHDSDDDTESIALSPVGPWVMDDFSAVGVSIETPRSPSVSTCYSVSSLGSEDLEPGGGGEWSHTELAAMSPRSRLLYFSACADESETARSVSSQLQRQGLRRSATCGSGLLASMKLASLESRATKPKRCSSATTSSTRGKPRPSYSSTAAVSKGKAGSQANPARKRLQSGGVVSSRSSQSDEPTPRAS